MKPLVRKDGVVKAADDLVDPGESVDAFPRSHLGGGDDARRHGLEENPRPRGPRALAGFGSAKGSNEEAYLFQKLIRTGFGSNNVDHCTRLCHASSVAALLEGVGSARGDRDLQRVQELRRHHRHRRQPDREPPGRRHLLQAGGQARRQARRHGPAWAGLKRHAWQHDAVRNGTDVAMLNGMLNVIIGEKLYDQQYVQTYVEGFDQLADNVKDFTPEEMAPICGIRRRHLARSGAHLCARAKAPSSSGAWACRSTPTAPTTRAA